MHISPHYAEAAFKPIQTKTARITKAKRMSLEEKIKEVSKNSVKKPMIVEDSDDDCETIPIERSKTKAKALEAAKNPFIDYESVENPEECNELEAVGKKEIDYVASDVEEQEVDGDPSMADGHDFSPLELDSSDWQYLQRNGEQLICTNDLESLKNFVENCLQQQGKWSSPGGNNKQFKSCNNKLVITWYFKKQLTLVFQGQDGLVLKEKLFKLAQDKLEKITDSSVHDKPEMITDLPNWKT